MKKFLSLLLSSAMVMSMSAANVMADDATEDTRTQINSIEADPEAIYFYNSAATDGEYLKSHCKITVDGVDITNDCHFRRISGYYLSNIFKDSFPSGNFRECTVVLPPEGTEFAVNKPITIEVEDTNNIKGRSDSFMLYEYVNDDFENGLNWKSASGTAPTINTDAQGNKRLNLPKDATVVSNDYANQKDWTDYTISFDIIGGESEYTDWEVVRFIYNDSDTLKNRLDQTARGYAFNNGHTRMFYKSNGNGDSWGFNSSAGTYVAANATRHYKLNAQDGYMSARIKTDIGTQKFMDYKIPETHETKTAGAPTFVFCNSTGNAYLDNVRITKMIALDNVEEELTFSGINADTDGITVYANKAVDTKVMNELVTLKDENGTVIPTKVENISNMQYGSSSDFATNNLSGEQSIIKKADGTEIAADKIYTIEIASGVMSSDFAAVSKEKISKTFKLINVLSDDFSGDLNWQFVQKNSDSDKQGTNSVAIENETLKITTGSENADNQVLVPANYSDMLALKNSTVEFDINCVTSPEFIFGFSQNSDGTFSDLASGTASKSKIRVGSVEESMGRACIFAHFGNPAYHAGWQNKVNGLVANSNHSYKLAGFDTNYNFYMDGNRGYTRTANSGNPNAIGTFAMLFTKADAVYTLDNVKITRMAEIENLTFSENINADTDGITVYPSKDVNTDDMARRVTLKDGNGTTIPVKVEKVVNHEGYKSEFVQNKPYIIKKADGNELAADTDYYLTIASGVVSNDEAAVSVSDVTKAFKLVDVLSDDFSGDLNWQLVHSNPSTDYWSNNTIEVKDGKLHIKLGDVNDPGEQRLVPLNYKDMFDLQDCTVKFDFNALDATYSDNWARFGFTKSEKADDIKDAHGEFHLQPTAIRIYVNAANNNWTYVTTDMATQIEDTYKFVGDGKEYSIYRNGVRVASRAEDDDAYKAQGAFAMLFCGNANTEYTLDNVKITRMTEIEKELKINTVEITADNASKDSVSGLTKANITAKIKNTVSQSQTATVILGVYDGVSNMTNVAVKENYNLTNGVNTVDFGEVEIKGGTQIKVFVFEDLTTLEPLCAHVEK